MFKYYTLKILFTNENDTYEYETEVIGFNPNKLETNSVKLYEYNSDCYIEEFEFKNVGTSYI